MHEYKKTIAIVLSFRCNLNGKEDLMKSLVSTRKCNKTKWFYFPIEFSEINCGHFEIVRTSKNLLLKKLLVYDFLLIHSLLMETINKATNYDLISISSYSRLYSGIVDFLKCKMYTRKICIFLFKTRKDNIIQHSEWTN